MPLELTHSFNWLTNDIIDCKIFKNPIWISTLITISVLIIIILTNKSLLWRIVFIYIISLIILFIFNASLLRKISGAKEITGAIEMLGNLNYLDNPDGMEINPIINNNL